MGSRNDLYGIGANVHLTYNKLIRIGMSFYRRDLSYDDLLQIPVPSLISFHLRA